jgi:DNA mismatch repair protein PMS2
LINLADDTVGTEDIILLDADPAVSESIIQSETSSDGNMVARPEVVRSSDEENISMRFDISRVSERWHDVQKTAMTLSRASDVVGTSSELQDAGVSNVEDDSKATDALSRVIDKEDFASMEIAGQFNLGFIVTRRRKIIDDGRGEMDDLFIVDQHAADEKYNYETLQQTTIIESQKLFRLVCRLCNLCSTNCDCCLRPQPLELTAADEMLAMENIEVLQQNGFEVDVDDDTGSGLGHRLKLVAQPVSKSTTFDMKG